MSEGGPLTALFAATYPERCRALVLYGTFARFASWLPTEEALAEFLGYIDQAWGTGGSLPLFAPTRANDPSFQRWWGRFERLGASPAAASALMRMNSQIDISGILPTIRVPTLVIHRTEDVTINVEGGRYLAEHIPGARYLELPGTDHIPFVGDNADEIADAIEEFLTGARAPVTVDRVLATVLFTDIVGSTEKAAALGDRRWRDLLDNHHATIRRNLVRFRGHEIKTTGDGILATFDGPARGVRCACAIADEIRPLGIEVRAGLHTGECEMIDDDVGGIAVHIGARVASFAGAGEVLVSSTVKDLVAGSGLRFGDRGSRSLRGVPGEWHICRRTVKPFTDARRREFSCRNSSSHRISGCRSGSLRRRAISPPKVSTMSSARRWNRARAADINSAIGSAPTRRSKPAAPATSAAPATGP
jgi:class 3 adenylate cyclase